MAAAGGVMSGRQSRGAEDMNIWNILIDWARKLLSWTRINRIRTEGDELK